MANKEIQPKDCRKAIPSMDGTWKCLASGNPCQDCQNCQDFQPRHIQFPIQVQKIEIKQPYLFGKPGGPVAVRLAGDDADGKTYLGLFIGEIPWITSCQYNRKNEKLKILTAPNPAMYVFELNKIVFGAESWWRKLNSPEDLKAITDDDIENTWYVKLLKQRFESNT